jgi:Tfp pilus assembly protein PilE
MFKKGAMFGLDARIALAIFGALSVISGAALYSAIKQAKSTAILTEMREIAKGFEQYYLDTGQMPKLIKTVACSLPCMYEVEELITNKYNVSGWKGPYIPYSVIDYLTLQNGVNRSTILQVTKDDTWGGTGNEYTSANCANGKNCSLWVFYSGFTDASLLESIDKDIDSANGGDAGFFRYQQSSAPWNYVAYLEFMPIKNPN